MGNKFSASRNDNSYLSCLGCTKESKSKKSKKLKHEVDVLPEDLHANNGQDSIKQSCIDNSNLVTPISPSQRLNSLENQASIQGEPNSKFPAFPLHGVQKSSPIGPSKNDLLDQENCPDKVDVKKIEKLYEYYRDQSSDEDAILAEGVERFCLDLKVDPTEFIVLALAWKFKAETMCKFTRKEFTEGFLRLKCDSIEQLKSSFKQIEADAIDNFKDLYRYTFQFALDAELGQRSLPCQIAIAMWNVVFSINPPSLLKSWLSYLQQHNVRGISRDTWNMFLYLADSLDDDFSNYNDNEAWPSLFDDFVDYEKEIRGNQKKLSADESGDAKASSLATATPLDDNGDTKPPMNGADHDRNIRNPEIPGATMSSNEGSFQEEVSGEELRDMRAPKGSKRCNDNVGELVLGEVLLSQLHADTPSTADL